MLSREMEPTFFTLLFGIMFAVIGSFGLIATATGNAHFQKEDRARRQRGF